MSFASATASAQVVAPLVVVVTDNPEAPFVRRLAAELALFGYRVELQARSSTEADLSALLERSRGAALISVDQGSQTAEVVVGGGAARGPARRERERLDPRRRADTNAAVLAERFRARLTELGIAPTTDAEAAPPPVEARGALSATPGASPPAPPRLWLAGALGLAAGGLGPLPEAELELRAFPVRFLSTSAFGRLTLRSADVEAAEGRAEVKLLSTGVLVEAYPLHSGRFLLKAGLGALLTRAAMSGHPADASGAGRSVAVVVPGAMLDLGAVWRLSPRLATELRGHLGTTLPGIGVHFEGRHVAEYGQPFYGVSVGAAFGVF